MIMGNMQQYIELFLRKCILCRQSFFRLHPVDEHRVDGVNVVNASFVKLQFDVWAYTVQLTTRVERAVFTTKTVVAVIVAVVVVVVVTFVHILM